MVLKRTRLKHKTNKDKYIKKLETNVWVFFFPIAAKKKEILVITNHPNLLIDKGMLGIKLINMDIANTISKNKDTIVYLDSSFIKPTLPPPFIIIDSLYHA